MNFTVTGGILFGPLSEMTTEPFNRGLQDNLMGQVRQVLAGFVMSAANELSGLRINVVSPTVLTEALDSYGPFFPRF